MDKRFSKEFVDNYSLVLLNWAKGKTGSSELAQELVQNVWVQFFYAVQVEEEKGNSVQKPENFLWKIAHYVWCNFLSAKKSPKNNSVSLDDSALQIFDNSSSFIDKLLKDEENKTLIIYMRQTIMKLNYLQREILISFYIDGKSQKEIAEKLNVPVSTVKWHLFDTRIKLKEEIKTMEKSNETLQEFIYRPKHLHVAINGQPRAEMDTNKINASLAKQNICLSCYEKPQTLNQLNSLLGIPKPYLEDDLNWLVEKEFILETKDGYQTNFEISNEKTVQGVYEIYLKYRKELSDVIVSELMKAEEKIKACGFYGNTLPMNKLLWILIYFLCAGFDSFKDEEIDRPIHSDGGKYFTLGFDCSRYDDAKICLDTRDWSMNGPMSAYFEKFGKFMWYGLYNFGESDIIDIVMEKYKHENLPLSKMLEEILGTYDGKSFSYSISSLDNNQKETLALLVKKGFVKIEDEKVLPNFCVFNRKQMEEITPLFEAIKDKVEKAVLQVKADLYAYYEKQIPKPLKYMKSVFVNQALGDLGWLTTMLAFNDKKLFVPATKEEGEFLTLLFVKV